MDSKYKNLVQVLRTPNSDEGMWSLIRDLMTQKELDEFSKRLAAAEMLSSGVPYIKIVEKTGLSSTTVARVALWLKEGEGGYRKLLNYTK